MVQDASARRHSARGDRIAGKGFGFLDASDVMCDGAGTPALGLGKFMILDVLAEDLTGVCRHRAIEEYWNVRQSAG